MTKRQLIDEITNLNPTAAPAFLAAFKDHDLAAYLQHLRWVAAPEVLSPPADGPAGSLSSEAATVEASAPAAVACLTESAFDTGVYVPQNLPVPQTSPIQEAAPAAEAQTPPALTKPALIEAGPRDPHDDYDLLEDTLPLPAVEEAAAPAPEAPEPAVEPAAVEPDLQEDAPPQAEDEPAAQTDSEPATPAAAPAAQTDTAPFAGTTKEEEVSTWLF